MVEDIAEGTSGIIQTARYSYDGNDIIQLWNRRFSALGL